MKYSEIKKELEKKNKKNNGSEPYKKIKVERKLTFDRKVILTGSIFLAVSFLIFFIIGVSGRIEPMVNHNIKRWINDSRGRHFEVNSFEYADFHLIPGGAVFKQIRARGVIRYDYPYFQPRSFELDIPILEIYFRWGLLSGLDLGLGISGLEIRGGAVLPLVAESRRRLESISDLTFQAWVPISGAPLRLKRELTNWARQFKNWLLNGEHMRSVYMSGNASFLADGIPVKVYFFSNKDSHGKTFLEGERNGMREIAQLIEPKFTEEDVLVAAKNLLKTPKLLDVRTRAEAKATAAYKAESGISYDTFRHIFWSYYLTQSFGPDFAVRVTNAHEFEDPGNTAEESEKDRRNNAFGIEYAQRKLAEKDIEKMIDTDPRIRQNQAT